MNGKFNKKEILKQIEKNRKSARKLVADSVRDAKEILHNSKLLGYASSPLAVVKLAEAFYRIEASVIQGKAKVEQMKQQIIAKEKALREAEKSRVNGQRRSSSGKTPVA